MRKSPYLHALNRNDALPKQNRQHPRSDPTGRYDHETARDERLQNLSGEYFGADRGNRTLLGSLEGYSITTMLCPRTKVWTFIIHPPRMLQAPGVFFAQARIWAHNNLQQALDFSATTYFVPPPVMPARLWLVRRTGFRYRSFPAVADTLQGCSSIG